MTLASVLLPERDCATCQNQTEWGCESKPFIPIMFPGDEEPMDRCPRRPFLDSPDWFAEVFAIHAWREKGMLPEPGGWKDQGAKLPTLLNVIDMAINEARAELDKRAKAKARRDSRASKQHPAGSRARRPARR